MKFAHALTFIIFFALFFMGIIVIIVFGSIILIGAILIVGTLVLLSNIHLRIKGKKPERKRITPP